MRPNLRSVGPGVKGLDLSSKFAVEDQRIGSGKLGRRASRWGPDNTIPINSVTYIGASALKGSKTAAKCWAYMSKE